MAAVAFCSTLMEPHSSLGSSSITAKLTSDSVALCPLKTPLNCDRSLLSLPPGTLLVTLQAPDVPRGRDLVCPGGDWSLDTCCNFLLGVVESEEAEVGFVHTTGSVSIHWKDVMNAVKVVAAAGTCQVGVG